MFMGSPYRGDPAPSHGNGAVRIRIDDGRECREVFVDRDTRSRMDDAELQQVVLQTIQSFKFDLADRIKGAIKSALNKEIERIVQESIDDGMMKAALADAMTKALEG
jgi:hypothetical protein